MLLIPAFRFCKKSTFFGKNGTFTQCNSMRDALDIFKLSVCLVDDDISPSPNLHLDWVTVFKVPFTVIYSHCLMYRETIL